MLREPVKAALARLGRTAGGRHLVHAATAVDRGSGRFRDATWPQKVTGFEDLDFLFTSSQLNHGIASLRFDEAAFLFRLARSLGRATLVELGRFKGGSTFLLAVAMMPGSELWSYDLHVETPVGASGPDLDAELAAALERYRLEAVHLVVADTQTASPPDRAIDLLFIDADHSYEGARADFHRWAPLVRTGGHLLFHDAVDTGGSEPGYPGIRRVVVEVEDEGRFRRAPGAGTIVHFVRQPTAAA